MSATEGVVRRDWTSSVVKRLVKRDRTEAGEIDGAHSEWAEPARVGVPESLTVTLEPTGTCPL